MNEPPYYSDRTAKLIALAQSRFDSELSPAESRVLFNSVRPGPAPTSDKKLDRKDVELRAGFLRWLVVDTEAYSLFDPNGLQVAQATVVGHLDFYAIRCSYDLNFRFCTFEEEIDLQSAYANQINIIDSLIEKGIDARYVTTAKDFNLTHCDCSGVCDFDGCHIGESLRIVGTIVRDQGDETLSFEHASIGTDLQLQGMYCIRALRANAATVGGNVFLKGAIMTCEREAVRLDVAEIKGELFLDELVDSNTGKSRSFQCAGDFHAPHLRVGEDIHASNAVFSKKNAVLDLVALDVKNGSLEFDGITTFASIDFSGSQIGAEVNIERVQIHTIGVAARFDDIVVGQSVSLRHSTTPGDISMTGAAINGSFFCEEATIGALLLSRTRIEGDLKAADAIFTNRQVGFAADNLHVGHELNLKGVRSSRSILMTHTTIGNDCRFDGAKIGATPGDDSIALAFITIGGGLILSRNLEADGPIHISESSVGINVSCIGSRMASFELANVQVAGRLYWFGMQNARKTALALNDSVVQTLYDDRGSWPGAGLLNVTGFRYQDLILCEKPSENNIQNATIPYPLLQAADDRIEWLKLQNSHDVTSSQPWLQLATFFEGRGDSVSAKRVRYMMGRVQSYSQGRFYRDTSFPYDKLTENPLRIIYPMASLWALGTLIFWRAKRMNAMAPTENAAYLQFKEGELPASYVPFNPIVYTLETVLPVVKFGQDSAWAPDPAFDKYWLRRGWKRWRPQISYRSLSLLRWVLIVCGWLLALVLVGAIASRFKD